MKETSLAKVVKAVYTIGKGTDESPVGLVNSYWTKDGQPIASVDGFPREKQLPQSQEPELPS